MPFQWNGRVLICAAALMAAMALSGCGGGGGGGVSNAGPRSPSAAQSRSNPAAPALAAVGEEFAFGADAEGGRIVRASVKLADKETIGVAASKTGTDPIEYSVEYPALDAGYSFSVSGSISTSRDSASGLYRAGLSQTVRNGAARVDLVLYTDYDEEADGNGDGTPGDDTDYMAAGLWVIQSAGSGIGRYPAAGLFVYGNKPYSGAHLRTLGTGTSRLGKVAYSGLAAGKRVSGTTVTDFTGAPVSLTANFDIAAIPASWPQFYRDIGAGMVEGTVDLPGSQQVKLGSALIYYQNLNRAAVDGGQMWSDAQMLDAQGEEIANFDGVWSAMFFGVDDSGGPNGVAGMFHLADDDENPTNAVLGVFLANR